MATREQQIQRLAGGFASSGLLVLNDYNGNDRPVLLIVSNGEATLELRVFCWNITPGGHGRSPDERRVQTTRPGDVPLHIPGGPQSLVLGYEENLDVFAAWDPKKHPNPTGSASLQIARQTLEAAAEAGFAGHERPLGPHGVVEVVAAFRPELIGEYLEITPDLDVTDPQEGSATAAAASGEERPIHELPGGVERRRAIARVARVVRNAQFRSRVLRAYGARCAFCGLGVGLAQAAHVRPVHLGGEDQMGNGIAACPTHHAAFDRGLITITDDYAVVVRDERLDEIGATGEDVVALRAGLRDRLHLPEDEALRPTRSNLSRHRAQWEA